MKVTINDMTLWIVWGYSPDKVITTCTIYDDTEKRNPEIIASTHVQRYFKDSHCKDKARKRSLAKAFKATNFNKEERRIVWNAYRNRKQQVAKPEAVVQMAV